ncbi:nitronate monooxygenase [Streptomyces albireticuli]|uniref:Probable nitronate monooxygenase n=1 Tax=Streptomyces albireticuli TaxID=1940 RepID=A0A2A2D0W6_9ACTN|nr:nitronate monooxygenase [Streptomyces albireticuli]MCD9141793.1 nitronate monooxygenase [Streptomyces albireticuli]MCD9163263.1 nitronate monooxygenase [Streptomyces albireticuli]MCD9189967.1 nitronate monooxygenase [Streptomyces albireticuli]PAU45059.1 2-nitropropane dioxygenase [Streptomyces albireticuli]
MAFESRGATTLTGLYRHPIVQAPMAGGPSCPALAAAVSEAGGLGSLAAGYKTPAAMYEEIKQLRARTAAPFGVNLFMPQPPATDPAAVEVYAEQLAGEAAWYGTPLGDTDRPCDDAYDAKLAILLDDPVPLVSFTFGCPAPAVVEALAGVGTVTVVTVTSVAEARAAHAAGADALCVQGTEAGGHQGTHHDDPHLDGTGAGVGLLTLLAEIGEAVDLPMIAAGGLMRGAQIAAVLAAGAVAAQLGTAFVPCPESGAHDLHKRALTDPEPVFTGTELTRAFSGRPARGLVNRFLREHGPYAPAAYPQVHYLTSGLRKAAAAAGDPQGMNLWAGQGHRLSRELPAARLVEVLAAELAAARGADRPPARGEGYGTAGHATAGQGGEQNRTTRGSES